MRRYIIIILYAIVKKSPTLEHFTRPRVFGTAAGQPDGPEHFEEAEGVGGRGAVARHSRAGKVSPVRGDDQSVQEEKCIL